MRKGIVFTMDGTLALIIVVIAIAAIPAVMQSEEEKGNPMQVLGSIAVDKANIDYYTGHPDNVGISEDAEFGQCAVYYTIEPNNSLLTRAEPQEAKACKDAE